MFTGGSGHHRWHAPGKCSVGARGGGKYPQYMGQPHATKIHACSVSQLWLFTTPWIVTHQASPWNFPSKNTGVDCHFLFQGIFLTQGPNPCLLHLLNWQADFFTLGSPTTKNYLVLNISSTEIQKPCCGFKKRALGRGWILPALPLAGSCLWKVLSLANSMCVMEGQRLHGRWI